MSTTVTRVLQPGDEVAINAAFNEIFHTSRSLEEWRWKFRPDSTPASSVAAWDGDTLVAHNGGLPAQFQVDGARIKALQGVDTMSLAAKYRRPDWRQSWVDVMDYFAESVAADEGVSLLFGFTGGPAIRHMVSRARWDSVEPRRIPLLTRNAGSRSRSLASLLYVAQPVGDDEPRIDDLWGRLAHRYPVSMVRDLAHVKRRFNGHPTVIYHRFLVTRRFTSRAVAFVVFRTDAGVCRWADLVWDDEHSGALELISQLASGLVAQTGASHEALWLDGDPEAERHLRSWGYEGEFDPSGVVRVIRFLDESLHREAFAPGRVYTTMADADLV